MFAVNSCEYNVVGCILPEIRYFSSVHPLRPSTQILHPRFAMKDVYRPYNHLRDKRPMISFRVYQGKYSCLHLSVFLSSGKNNKPWFCNTDAESQATHKNRKDLSFC